jgi:thioredoxin reductase
MDRPTDPSAIDNKFPPPDEHVQLLIIGAGPAGLAAAIEAAGLGLSVVVIDENPVPAAMMGLDVPLFYGQRMNPAVQEEARMVERLVAATPAIEAAFDAGVDVRLGVTAWGAFANGPALNAMPKNLAGLTDGAKSWMCSFDALILATGARDLVLGFEGIGQPGVMGARALNALLTRYDAFDGKQVTILGSTDLAAETALALTDRGIEVTALIEVLPTPQASPENLAALAAQGAKIFTSTTIIKAESDATGITAAVLAPTTGGAQTRIPCDTICLAIGAVPAIELAGALNCRLTFSGEKGGHVPVTDATGATSIPGIFATGDCAGLTNTAESQARQTAEAAAAYLNNATPPETPTPTQTPDTTPYRQAWMRALLKDGAPQTPACICEEVSRSELLGIRPPSYLNCTSNKIAARDAKTLQNDGPLNPDQIKRLTRAGMGLCQGRRCREQIALTFAETSETPLAKIPLASYRAPVRPLPLNLLATIAETPGMAAHWDVWFGIRTQWIPYQVIGTPEEKALIEAEDGGYLHA